MMVSGARVKGEVGEGSVFVAIKKRNEQPKVAPKGGG
jgi:hypothetical protein